ncbi:MAG: IS3 family transposase [Gammaproteobacteria bacterium]
MGGRRGRLISEQDKITAIGLIKEACAAGSRLKPACELLEFDTRTFQRWNKECSVKDKRRGPLTAPGNKLSDAERAHILSVVNSPKYRNQPPSQIVPNLADQGDYIGSESTIYRVLHAHKMMRHRSAARPRAHRKPDELAATKPNQLWSWDITYLTSDIRGKYFYLYLFLDVFSRKIVGFDVFDEQSAEHASEVVSATYMTENVSAGEVTLHSDNGGPMKGSMMLATLQNLGVAASFSRPSVSNDNPYSESIFRRLKYCPQYPDKPFESTESALEWVKKFVNWYNNIHQHSGINFVTPNARHNEEDQEILTKRAQIYELAKQKNPSRWSGKTRNWARVDEVLLNTKRTNRKAA